MCVCFVFFLGSIPRITPISLDPSCLYARFVTPPSEAIRPMYYIVYQNGQFFFLNGPTHDELSSSAKNISSSSNNEVFTVPKVD